MKRIIYLSEEEEKALRLLAQGFNSYVIHEKCKLPMAGMGIFTQEIRRKTGIRDTKYARECFLYIKRFEEAMDNPPLTPDDLRLLRFYRDDYTLDAMASEWKTTPVEITARIESLFTHMGIFTKDERARRLQLRIYLIAFHAPAQPETPFHWNLLRMLARGLSFAEIAHELGERKEYIQFKTREICTKLGLLAKGRDVQRKLIRAFLATHSEPQSPTQDVADPLNDPMF